MRRSVDLIFLILFVVGLWSTGVWLLSQDELLLATKAHGFYRKLEGKQLVFFALFPILLGVTLFSAARRLLKGGELNSESVTVFETVCFLSGIVFLLMGILKSSIVQV